MKVRDGLLAAVVLLTSIGYTAIFVLANDRVVGPLRLLLTVFLFGGAATAYHYRDRLTFKLVSANVALGCIVHLVSAALVVTADQVVALGAVSAVAQHWVNFGVGVLGITGAAFTWTRARGADDAPDVVLPDAPEPAPPAVVDLEPPAWEAVSASLASPEARRHLASLQRLEAVLDEATEPAERVEAALRVVRQEAKRLQTSAAAEADSDDDVLSQAANLLEWGAQKLPELGELDVSDVLMAKAIADIRALRVRVEHRFIDHRKLRAIHPIDRATADAKCEERAAAARVALPLLEAHGNRLSEALINGEEALAAFRSVTGFQVVEIEGGQGFVTFEGNGRREALRRAFGHERAIDVEVRVFLFDDPAVQATIERRVQRVRRWKQVVDL